MTTHSPSLTPLAFSILERFSLFHPTDAQVATAESLITDVICQNDWELNSTLTRKEWWCLYWAAKGKSAKETGDILCLSEGTVKNYRHHIKQKLHCNTLAQAVHEGLQKWPF
jgi:DNA-binding CsgD family transcriptional regulator